MLAVMGVDGFAERARRELLATGQTVRTVETGSDLTTQEMQIAVRARDGHTNTEIGAAAAAPAARLGNRRRSWLPAPDSLLVSIAEAP
jgi:hypothetical protein